MRISWIGTLLLFSLGSGCHASAEGPQAAVSPYVGEEGRVIKALSAEEVAGLKAGAGLGYAKAAELNEYPGPRHVLDLAEALALTPAQQAETEAVFAAMEAEAKRLGAEMLAAETALDGLFAGGQATAETLAPLVAELGRLEGALRYAHLAAHLDTRALLTPEQVAQYTTLRGYTGHGAGGGHDHSGHGS